MGRTVRIGVIGCGDIAVSQHLPAIARNADVTLAGVCDAAPERMQPIARAYGVQGFTDAMRMLAECPMDAVVIATPPWVTPELTIAALCAGLYVLCEKPMALTLEEAERVAEAERTARGRVQLGFTYRHDPLLAQLRDWIAQDKLGHPLMYRLGIYDEIWDPVGNPEHYARLYKTMEHGCPSVHDGAHNADFLHFLTAARVTDVAAFGFRSRPEFPCSNYDTSVIRFANGDMAKLEIGWFFPVLPYGEFEVVGPKGFAAYDRLKRFVALQTPQETLRAADDENWWSLCFRVQLQSFVRSVMERSACVPGCAEGIYSLDLCKRIEASIQSNEKR